MGNHADLVKGQMEIGSTIYSGTVPYLIEGTPMDDKTDMDDEYTSIGSQYDDHLIDELCEGAVSGDTKFDGIIIIILQIIALYYTEIMFYILERGQVYPSPPCVP